MTQEILILFNFAADFHLSQYLPFIHQQWRSLTNSGSLTPSFWWSHRLWSDCSGELLQLRIISRLLAAYSIHVVFLRISGNSSWTCNPTFHVFYHLIRNFPENLFSPFPDFLSVRLWKLDPVKFQLYHTRQKTHRCRARFQEGGVPTQVSQSEFNGAKSEKLGKRIMLRAYTLAVVLKSSLHRSLQGHFHVQCFPWEVLIRPPFELVFSC